MTIFMTSPHVCGSRGSEQSSSRTTNTGENGAVMNRAEFMRRKTHVERSVVSGEVKFVNVYKTALDFMKDARKQIKEVCY